MKDLSSVTHVKDEDYFALEDQHGDLVPLIVVDHETSKEVGEFLFKRPTDRELNFANREIIKNENLGARNDLIINATLLNGQEVVSNNDWVRRALHNKVDAIITPYDANLGKRRKRPVVQSGSKTVSK